MCVGCRYVTWINHQESSRFIEATIYTVSEVCHRERAHQRVYTHTVDTGRRKSTAKLYLPCCITEKRRASPSQSKSRESSSYRKM